MPYVVGTVLALAATVFGRVTGFDRDRAFYATMVVVVASYYVLFAVLGGSTRALVMESLVMAIFAAAAVVGFRTSGWIVAVALAGHGLFDAVHGQIIDNAGVPAYWPAFCGAYDVVAGACLGWLLRHQAGASATRA